jgi:uncharacterized protein (TIGR03067 family)
MKRCIVGFVMLAAVGGAVVAEDKADADVKKLQGEWNIEAIEIQGKKIDGKGKAGGIVFAKDMKVIMKSPGQKDSPGTYKIDATKKPKHLDLIEGEKKEVIETIYELDGDSLKMGLPTKGPKGKRPAGFDDKESVIMHLKRQK